MRVAVRHRARLDQDSVESTLTVGDVHIDLVRRRVLLRGAEVHLSPIEYRLLATLVHYAGRVVTHRQLLREVWGRTRKTMLTTFASTWRISGESSRMTPPGRGIS